MKVDRISYQKIFPTGMAYLNHKIGVEIQLDEGDSETQVFLHAKSLVEQWNIESNPSYAAAMEYMKPTEISRVVAQSEKENKDERIQSFIATINMCANLKFLKNFETRVHQENNQELLDAYNKKLSEFL